MRVFRVVALCLVSGLSCSTIAAAQSLSTPSLSQKSAWLDGLNRKPGYYPDGKSGYLIQSSRTMRGNGLPWEHEVQVALPPSYFKGDKTYPVLWVTDGSYRFKWAIDTLILSGVAQEMIIVAVGAPPDALGGLDGVEVQKRRTYDFTPKVDVEKIDDALQRAAQRGGFPLYPTGGAPEFLAFVADQIRSDLSKQYRMSDDHVLFGTSGGGAFCVYALFSRPEAFRSFICNSPAFDYGDGGQFSVEERYSQSHRDLRANLFFSAGEGEILLGGVISGFHVVSSMIRMAEVLKLREYPSLNLHVKIFPAETHHTWTNTLSLRWALRALYMTKVADDRPATVER